MTTSFQTAWISFPGSPIRFRVLLPSELDLTTAAGQLVALLEASRSMVDRFTLDDSKFPVRIDLFDSADAIEPIRSEVVRMRLKEVEDDIVPEFSIVEPETKPSAGE